MIKHHHPNAFFLLFSSRHTTDPPKIHLDTSGSGNKNVITVVAGNKLRFDVEVTGEPAPTVCWSKGEQVRTDTGDSHHSPFPGSIPRQSVFVRQMELPAISHQRKMKQTRSGRTESPAIVLKCDNFNNFFLFPVGKVVCEAEGRVRVETRETLSSFVIEGAERADEGLYTITVANPAGEDKAEIFVRIVGQGFL